MALALKSVVWKIWKSVSDNHSSHSRWYEFLWKDEGLLVKNISIMDLWFLVKLVFDFVKFVKLKTSQSWLNFSKSTNLFVRSILKLPINTIFSYLRTNLLKKLVGTSKKMVKLLDAGGLYILKETNSFLRSGQFRANTFYIIGNVLRYYLTNETIFDKFDENSTVFISILSTYNFLFF